MGDVLNHGDQNQTLGSLDLRNFPGVHASLTSLDRHDEIVFVEDGFVEPAVYQGQQTTHIFVPKSQWGEYRVVMCNGGATPMAFRDSDLFTPGMTNEEISASVATELKLAEHPRVKTMGEFMAERTK